MKDEIPEMTQNSPSPPSPVLEASARDLQLIGAMAAPATLDLAGHTVHAFSSMRKAFVQMTNNEFVNSQQHFEAYLAAHGITESSALAEIVAAAPLDLSEQDRETWVQQKKTAWENNIQMDAIPNSAFHLTALAFICVSEVATLQPLMASRADFP